MAPKLKPDDTSFDVDYVISYRYLGTEKATAVSEFEKLIQALAEVGLQTEVRNGENHTLLIFVKPANEQVLATAVYRSRVNDWLNGVRQAQPDKDTQNILTSEPLTTAERLRLVHQMITAPKNDGGADITPKQGDWKNVESIFALHDPTANKAWVKSWSGKTFLTPDDLDALRDAMGEKIAYYFAFLQSYFAFLLFPAVFGFSAWVLLGHFSPIYGIVNSLWSVIFVEWWKRQEKDLALRWGVRNVSQYSFKRKDFKYQKEFKDPITGETITSFPAATRLSRQALQIPFALLASLMLGSLIAACFGIEIFISEVYDGPFKAYLVFMPTVLLTVFVPTITGILSTVATKLNDYENYETQDSYDVAMTQKIFVLNFITSYLPIFLTAFVYVPFASILVPYLDVFSLTVKPFATSEKQMETPSGTTFTINPDRLRKQVIYFTVTAQVVNFAMETIVPLLKQKGTSKFKAMQSERAAKKGGRSPSPSSTDPEEEKEFLTRVRSEAELNDYEVTDDLREMCVQFGYLTLFSVVWPLVPVSFLVNNWIELRSDAFKIALECKRPTPERADSIGPWLDTLGFLSWLGSITSSALVYMFSGDGLGPAGTPHTITGWALLLTIIFAEHVYLIVQIAVRLVISKIDSPNMQKERAEKYLVRKRYLEETLGGMNAITGSNLSSETTEKITRESLEEDARQASLRDSNPSVRFWGRQRGWKESGLVGKSLIEAGSPESEASGETKKEL